MNARRERDGGPESSGVPLILFPLLSNLETSVFLFTAPTHMHPNVERTGDAIHFQGMNGSYDVMVASTDEQED